jgi:PPE-repeat protein
MIDFAMFPPEFNSTRMYAGPGSGPMLAAATAWNGLSADLESAASSYQSVISGLTDGPWLGPASMSMAAAAATYLGWMNTTAAQAAQTAGQIHMFAAAFDAAFAATVPPPVIAANRAQLMALVATNFLGQNTPAIMATEAQYTEMWAQDAAAMYGYAGSAAVASQVSPWATPVQNTNLAGLAAQHATAGAGGAANAQTVGSQTLSAGTQALQSLASPASSTAPFGSGLSPVETDLLMELINPADISVVMYPGVYGMMLPTQMLGVFSQVARGAATPAAGGAAATAAKPLPVAAPHPVAGPASAPRAVTAGMGQANSLGNTLGRMSVPQSWAAATTPPAPMLGGVPLGAVPLAAPGTGVGAGSAAPLMFGGLPQATAAGGKGAGNYGLRPAGVMARPPAAGYAPLTASVPTTTDGLTLPPPVPGYKPAIIYLPTNGHALPTNGHVPVGV